ncbi:MAG TPA: (d)CMP kinase [Mariniphaga sp.]|nr:(d)CMP kinase [Mariniphaga sp.]
MTERNIVIAIDGHSSCGKSTLAKSLARELGYVYIDSGAMYRAVTLYALRKSWIGNGHIDKQKIIDGLSEINISFQWDESTERNTTFLNGENVEDEIRQLAVSQYVSPVSAIAEVRTEMVRQQREQSKNTGIVMDGRDIGTVVFPDADLKIFMTAAPEIRSQRRFKELKDKGQEVRYEDILQNIEERDTIDSGREVSPLIKADDAEVLDNSYLTRDEQLRWSLSKVKEKIEEYES